MVKKILIFFQWDYSHLAWQGCSSSGHAGSVSVQTGPAEELPGAGGHVRHPHKVGRYGF